MFYNTSLKIMFLPNLVSNSLVTNSRSSSEEVQVKGKLVSGPGGCWESQGGCPAGLGGASLSPRALEPAATGSASVPLPHPALPAGACSRVSGPRLHVGRAAPAPRLLWPQCPGRPARLQTGAPASPGPWAAHISCGTPHVWQKLGKHACHVCMFTSQCARYCCNSSSFPTYMCVSFSLHRNLQI